MLTHKPRAFLALLLASLLGGLFAPPSHAQEVFDGRGVQFDVDTVVEFEFMESHGAYQSTFGVVNLQTGEKTPLIQEVKPSDTPQNVEVPSDFKDDVGRAADFLGSVGNTVTQPLAEFNFKANTPYAFYLESFLNGQSEAVFYSVDNRNPDNTQRVKFDSDINRLSGGGVVLNWDDTGSLLVMVPDEDRDFDDFLIRAGGNLACVYDQIGSAGTAGLVAMGVGEASAGQNRPAGFCEAPSQ
jgi:hypothetical protein